MASEDVIELGSSDDEAEPAPKKKKPMPNAMVHIPTKLPGLTIKPAKLNASTTSKILNTPIKSFQLPKGILSKPIMITKSNINTNVTKHKNISTPLRVPIAKNSPNIIKTVEFNANKFNINPISIAKNLIKPELVIKKVKSNKKLKKPVEIQGPRLLNNLPPGITIKPLSNAGASGMSKKRNVQSLKNAVGEVLTVEIDDEESVESSVASPQWYLRPEEQEGLNNSTKDNEEELDKSNDKIELTLEEQNNKEPETTNFVEITIEDSPVKPLQLKDRSEIGKELAITIEDSPVKPIKNKDVNSDNEESVEKVPQSKKKLDYPKERQVVEIEIDLMDTGSFGCNENGNENIPIEVNISNNDKLEKKPDEEKTNSIKEKESSSDTKNDTANSEKTNSKKEPTGEAKNDTANSEFHPVYQSFIDMCFKLENSEDMKKIVEKKIKAYYKQCPKEYVESEEFIDMVSSKTVSMEAAPDKMYLYIKDVVDELNLQRKMTKTIPSKTTDIVPESEKMVFSEESEYDSKRQRQIRKLEKTIKKLHRAIQKLEEQEVDFEDDEDSVYLLTERYKERMVRVHAKFCQLTNTKMPSEPRIHIEVRPGRPVGPVRKLEKWINRKVPIGTPLPFPDFHDVLQCVRAANDEDKLGWNEVDIMEEARDLFTRCGKKLQRRRQENEWRLAVSRISNDMDPAEENLELKKQLDENKSMAFKRETEVLNKYVDRQDQLKLVAEEIGDKEAEESPVESEDEEISEDVNPLENKHKRKERLKRLLQEKSRKTEEKENKPEEEKENNTKDKETPEEDKQIESEKKTEDDNSNKIDVAVNDDQTVPVVDNISENVDEDTTKTQTTNEITEPEKGESDENEFESDIDELHLLQKLHSENESDASTVESSDSDTPIAISDTLDSDSDVEYKNSQSDVISIENSSYSESEEIADGLTKEDSVKRSKVEDLVNSAYEIEYSATDPSGAGNENIVENILLASSDEENSNKITNYGDTCINLKDDDISISETTIDGEASLKVNDYNEKSLLENKNDTMTQEDSVDNEHVGVSSDTEKLEQDNISNVDSVMECSDADEGTNSIEQPKDDVRSMSDVNSVESVDMQSEQNEDDSNGRQTDSVESIKTISTDPGGFDDNKEGDIQNEIVQTEGSTANIETANNNMETD